MIFQHPAVKALNAAFLKHSAVGTFLGIYILRSSPAAFLDVNLSNGEPASDYEADYDHLFEKGYIYAKKIAGVLGTYIVNAPTCTSRTNVVSFWRYSLCPYPHQKPAVRCAPRFSHTVAKPICNKITYAYCFLLL